MTDPCANTRPRCASGRLAARAIAALALAASLHAAAPAHAQSAAAARSTASSSRPQASVSLVQCLPAAQQGERAAAFSGEMGAVAGTARMEMRIEVLERLPGESAFQEVVAPGLGGWRLSAPGVKQFKYIKQVTNLAAPADYRASVRFRWLSARGRLIKAEELHTARCEQPAPMELPPEVGTPAPA